MTLLPKKTTVMIKHLSGWFLALFLYQPTNSIINWKLISNNFANQETGHLLGKRCRTLAVSNFCNLKICCICEIFIILNKMSLGFTHGLIFDSTQTEQWSLVYIKCGMLSQFWISLSVSVTWISRGDVLPRTHTKCFMSIKGSRQSFVFNVRYRQKASGASAAASSTTAVTWATTAIDLKLSRAQRHLSVLLPKAQKNYRCHHVFPH